MTTVEENLRAPAEVVNGEDNIKLAWATYLAKQGFRIGLLKRGSKFPVADRSWTQDASCDPGAVWRLIEDSPGHNFLVNPGPSFVIVDLDRKHGKDGIAVFDALEKQYGRIKTLRVKSPSGGVHIYFRVPEPVSNAHRFGKGVGIDVRGESGYVLLPGSELIEGLCKPNDVPGFYEVIDDSPIADAPAWVLDRLRKPEPKGAERNLAPVDGWDLPHKIEAASGFLKNRPPAIEGRGGDDFTYKTICELRDFGVSDHTALNLMLEDRGWNDRCAPSWKPEDLAEKIVNVYKYAQNRPGDKWPALMEKMDEIGEDASAILKTESTVVESSELDSITFDGVAFAKRGKRAKYAIPNWVLDHGLHCLKAKRGVGKTITMLDLALRFACDMDLDFVPMERGWAAVYICAEDDEGLESNFKAWTKKYDKEPEPGRMIVMAGKVDLLNAESVKKWTLHLLAKLNSRRAVLFVDTWQRVSATGSQNDDQQMQLAVDHIEAMARSLRGPVIAAFHPPKGNEETILGSSIIENSSVAIWALGQDIKTKQLELKVTRIKGRGFDSKRIIELESIGLGEHDQFGREETGVVAKDVGGTDLRNAEAEFAVTVANACRGAIDDLREKAYPVSLRALAGKLVGTKHGDYTFPEQRATEEVLKTFSARHPLGYRFPEEHGAAAVLRITPPTNAASWQCTLEPK